MFYTFAVGKITSIGRLNLDLSRRNTYADYLSRMDKKSEYKVVSMYARDDKSLVNIFNGDLAIDLMEVFVS